MALIENGVYLKDGIKITYNGQEYWISKNMYEKVSKHIRIKPEELGISFVEYFDKELIDSSAFDILNYNLKHIKDENIIILTGRSNRRRNANLVNRLRQELLEKFGLVIYKIYYVGNKIHTYTPDYVSADKAKVILEHLIGLKIEDDVFVPIQQDKFETVYFYDDDPKNIDFAINIQKYFDKLLRKSEQSVYELVKNRIKDDKLTLITNLVTGNQINPFKTKTVIINEPIKYPIRMDEKLIYKFSDFLKMKNNSNE